MEMPFATLHGQRVKGCVAGVLSIIYGHDPFSRTYGGSHAQKIVSIGDQINRRAEGGRRRIGIMGEKEKESRTRTGGRRGK